MKDQPLDPSRPPHRNFLKAFTVGTLLVSFQCSARAAALPDGWATTALSEVEVFNLQEWSKLKDGGAASVEVTWPGFVVEPLNQDGGGEMLYVARFPDGNHASSVLDAIQRQRPTGGWPIEDSTMGDQVLAFGGASPTDSLRTFVVRRGQVLFSVYYGALRKQTYEEFKPKGYALGREIDAAMAQIAAAKSPAPIATDAAPKAVPPPPQASSAVAEPIASDDSPVPKILWAAVAGIVFGLVLVLIRRRGARAR